MRLLCAVLSLWILGLSPIVQAKALDETLIQQIEKTYQEMSGLKAKFTQHTYIPLLEREQKRSGVLYFGSNQFRIEYQKPAKQDYIFDGKTLWIYSPEHKEVEIYARAAEQIGREALAFLNGLGRLRDTFKIINTEKSGDTCTLTLEPKDKRSRLKELILSLDASSYKVKFATLWPKQGSKSRYTFSDLELNHKLAKKLFEFKPPSKVTIVRPDAS